MLLTGLALLAVAGLSLHKPFQAAKATVQQELEQERRTVASLRNLYARRHEFEARLQTAEETLAALKKQLERGRQQPSFLTYLEESARNAGVVVISLSFGAPATVADGTYLRYPVTLNALGHYPGVMGLVGRLEQVMPYVSADHIDISGSPAQTPTTQQPSRSPSQSPQLPTSLPNGWVRLGLQMSVLAESDGSSEWARELAEAAGGLGRNNPFERPGSTTRGGQGN